MIDLRRLTDAFLHQMLVLFYTKQIRFPNCNIHIFTKNEEGL
jgi:hypothetical protein